MELIDLNLDTYWKVLQLDFKCNTVEQVAGHCDTQQIAGCSGCKTVDALAAQ